MNIEQLVNLKAEAIRQIAMSNMMVCGITSGIAALGLVISLLFLLKDKDANGPFIGMCICGAITIIFGLSAAGNAVDYMNASAEAVKAITNYQLLQIAK